MVICPSGMQEEELRRYFLRERSVSELAQDLRFGLLTCKGSFSLIRLHLVMLCDASRDHGLTPEALNTVASLIASDAFEWG
jgi:hypothetical protein